MRILVTGANGYVGRRLVSVLLAEGHELICCVRDKSRFEYRSRPRVHVLEIDFEHTTDLPAPPREIDVAFYLIHSMNTSVGSFKEREATTARSFLTLLSLTECKQIVYLSGIVNEEELSRHLASRHAVEKILRSQRIPVTVLRAGIVVGSGSASFEIIRDLVEKLPVMIAPKWLHTLCQPIAVSNLMEFLVGVMRKEKTFNKDFDIGGPDVLTYEQMLLQYAEVRGLPRWIIAVPVMTPRLSSYWLYFITSTSYALAVNLVDSMKVNIVARPNTLPHELGIRLISYKESLQLALDRTEQGAMLSSWKDSFSSSGADRTIMQRVSVPQHGCYRDVRIGRIHGDAASVWKRVWTIGGDRGWYHADMLWSLRGVMDKLVGGVGLNRGRSHPTEIRAGDALDFWRVLLADFQQRRLLLFAEMKLPGEAWLEFRIDDEGAVERLIQTATFRPRGLLGRAYWFSVLPFHAYVFRGMLKKIVEGDQRSAR